MKNVTSITLLFALSAILMTTQNTYAQKMLFCDSLSNNKIVGQSTTFNIDDKSSIVTVLLYSEDKPFASSKLVLKFFEVAHDTTEHFLAKLNIDIPPNSRAYWRKLPFSSPNHFKVRAYTTEGDLICAETLTITARKQATGNAGFAAVLNEIVNFFPATFNNVKGTLISNDPMLQSWESTENLPGYDWASISSFGNSGEYWETTIIETADSTEALNKYTEISKLISQAKFDCCVFNPEEEYDYNNPKTSNTKTITWMPASVNTGKNKEFEYMPLQLRFAYPTKYNKEFTVKLNIGFESSFEKMLHAVKKIKN
jgi:hypothetical protein